LAKKGEKDRGLKKEVERIAKKEYIRSEAQAFSGNLKLSLPHEEEATLVVLRQDSIFLYFAHKGH